MILFTADFLKSKGFNINYEFEYVDKYLQTCKGLQENTAMIGNSRLLTELMEDLALFNYKEVYIFFEIKNIDGFECIYIYDYADLEYKILDTKENFAKVKTEDAIKLLAFQLSK